MENREELDVKKEEKCVKYNKGKNSRIDEIFSFIRKSKFVVICVIVVILVVTILFSILFAKERKITTIAESSLKEVIETSELSTVEFIYNSIVTVPDEDGNPKYHVAYEGTVKAGFDFNAITTEVDKENKKIVIVIPEIKINSVNINDETLDFIFIKDKYDTETTFQEAYKTSYDDLEKKAEANEIIKQTAYENAIDNMKAIIMPLEAKLPNGYSFDFREGVN